MPAPRRGRKQPTKRRKMESGADSTQQSEPLATTTTSTEQQQHRPPRKESFQLKTINACVGNQDISLPSRPTPGALVAFYMTALHASREARKRGCPGDAGTGGYARSLSSPTPPRVAQTESAAAAAPPLPPTHRTRSTRQHPARKPRASAKRKASTPDATANSGGGGVAEQDGEGSAAAGEQTYGWSGLTSSVNSHVDERGSVSWPRLAVQCRKYKSLQEHQKRSTRQTGFSSSSPVLAATLTPAQWMKSVAHVALGRHSCLPPFLRLHHPCVSRLHARVVFVENELMHTCLTTMYPCVFPTTTTTTTNKNNTGGGGSRGQRLGNEEDEKSDVYTSDVDFEKPYYLLMSCGENPLYVNGVCVPAGHSWPLTVGDVVSFLEDALDVEYGVVQRTDTSLSGMKSQQPSRGRRKRTKAGGRNKEGGEGAALEDFPLSSASSRSASPASVDSSTTALSSSGSDGLELLVASSSDDEDDEKVVRTPHVSQTAERSARRKKRKASVSRSQPFLELLLQAVLSSVSASPSSSSSAAHASLLRFATGTCVFSLLPGAVDVSPSAKRFVKLWMQLTAALRGEAEEESTETAKGSKERVENKQVAAEAATRSRFIVERNHLLLREEGGGDEDGNNGGASRVRDLSVSPAKVTRKGRKPGPSRRLNTRQDDASSPLNDTDDNDEDEECSEDGNEAEAESHKRVRLFLRGLAKELQRIATRQRHYGNEADPFPEDGDRDGGAAGSGIADEVVSPLRARLTLDARVLREVYLSLLSQAEGSGYVAVSGNPAQSTERSATPQRGGLRNTGGPTQLANVGYNSGSKARLISPVKEEEDEGNDGKSIAEGNRDVVSGTAKDEDESPIKRLLQQLRVRQDGGPGVDSPHDKQPPVSLSTPKRLPLCQPHAADEDGNPSVHSTPQSQRGSLRSSPLKLQSPNLKGGATASTASVAAPFGSRAAPRIHLSQRSEPALQHEQQRRQQRDGDGNDNNNRGDGDADGEDEEEWRERPEDGFGNPLPMEDDATEEPQHRRNNSASAQMAGSGSARRNLIPGATIDNAATGQQHQQQRPPPSPPQDQALSSERGTLDTPLLDAVLSPEDRATFRKVPALALHPAALPVYVFTRRSPSPDTTTTRFARQSRAANRDAGTPYGRREYVFYYDEEEQEQEPPGEGKRANKRTVVKVGGGVSGGGGSHRTAPADVASPGAREEEAEEERSFWVDEAEAGAAGKGGRKRGAPLARSAAKTKTRRRKRKD